MMSISQKTMENHKKLFPEIGIENTLDEELMEILLNFNFDEVQEQENLDKKTRQMVIIACIIASQIPKRYEVFVRAALLPYIGYPRSLNDIRCINEV